MQSKGDTSGNKGAVKKADPGGIRKKAEYDKSGLREMASTPVNASESSLSHPTVPPSLESAGAKRGRNRGLGGGDGSDSDSGNDGDKESEAASGHYDESKEKRKRRKDGEDDDSEDDGAAGGGDKKESKTGLPSSTKNRKDSKQTSSATQSRKSSKAETSGNGEKNEELEGGLKSSDFDTEMKDAHPLNEGEDIDIENTSTSLVKTPAKKARPSVIIKKGIATKVKKPTPVKRKTARQLDLETKKPGTGM